MAVFLSTVTATAVLAVTTPGSPGPSGETEIASHGLTAGEEQWLGAAKKMSINTRQGHSWDNGVLEEVVAVRAVTTNPWSWRRAS